MKSFAPSPKKLIKLAFIFPNPLFHQTKTTKQEPNQPFFVFLVLSWLILFDFYQPRNNYAYKKELQNLMKKGGTRGYHL